VLLVRLGLLALLLVPSFLFLCSMLFIVCFLVDKACFLGRSVAVADIF